MSATLVRTSAATVLLILSSGISLVAGGPAGLVGTLVAASCFGAVGTTVIALSAVAATRSVSNAAAAIRSGDFAARAATHSYGDAAGLVSSFNVMAKTVQETVEAASQEHGRLMAALNSSIDAIVAVDTDTRITFANDAARRLLAPQGRELVGSPFAWFVPDDRLVEALRASSEERRSLSVLIDRPNKQYLQAVTTPIFSGGDWASLAVFHDLSEVKRVEQVRRDFVANVSHELRTPLAALKSVIETLESGAKDDPASAADFLSRADSEVDRLVQMVEELLELSRLESGDIPLAREPLDIGLVLQNAVDRLRRQAQRAGVGLTLAVEDGLPPLAGDAEVLERVVINLIHNAVKFTPAGGEVRVRGEPSNGAIKISVSDTGVGILPEDLPRIFERFYKADRSRGAGGTGLGLAVARHAIEAHGGTISAESRPGEGSIFTLTLPVSGS